MISGFACAQPGPRSHEANEPTRSEPATLHVPGCVVFSDERAPATLLQVEIFAIPNPSVEGSELAATPELLLATVTDSDSGFEFELSSRQLQSDRILAIAWSEQHAGFLDWSSEHSWEIEHGEVPPLVIPVHSRDGELVVRAENHAGEALAGVRFLCTPAWNEFAMVEPNAKSVEAFCRRIGLHGVTDEQGISRFARLPRLDPTDTVFFVQTLDPDFVSMGSYFEGWPDEPYVGALVVERFADLSFGGLVIAQDESAVDAGTVSLNGRAVSSIASDGRWKVRADQLGDLPWTLEFDAPGYVRASFTPNRKSLLHEDANRWQITLDRVAD